MRKKKEDRVLSEENISERIFLMEKIIKIFQGFNSFKGVKLTQLEVAEIIGTNQPRVSCLFKPDINYMLFSSELLKDYLHKIGYKMTLKNKSNNRISLKIENNSKELIKKRLKEIRCK